jgi:hypothetical protein
MSRGDESFLARWSRRKQEVETPAPPVKGPEPKAEPEPEQKPEDGFDLSKLPSIESLGKDSDYSMFMHKAVPEELRLKALRRMWSTDPALSVPELLDIHAWDYTGTDGIKPLVTPALEALAAAAREAAKRAREAALEKKEPPADSPDAVRADQGVPEEPGQQSSG